VPCSDGIIETARLFFLRSLLLIIVIVRVLIIVCASGLRVSGLVSLRLRACAFVPVAVVVNDMAPPYDPLGERTIKVGGTPSDRRITRALRSDDQVCGPFWRCHGACLSLFLQRFPRERRMKTQRRYLRERALPLAEEHIFAASEHSARPLQPL